MLVVLDCQVQRCIRVLILLTSHSKSDRLKQWGSQWFPVSGTQLGFSSVRVQLLLDKKVDARGLDLGK
jgi:hypothetical protein